MPDYNFSFQNEGKLDITISLECKNSNATSFKSESREGLDPNINFSSSQNSSVLTSQSSTVEELRRDEKCGCCNSNPCLVIVDVPEDASSDYDDTSSILNLSHVNSSSGIVFNTIEGNLSSPNNLKDPNNNYANDKEAQENVSTNIPLVSNFSNYHFLTKDENNLRFYVCNLRGFFSKKDIMAKIIHDISADVIIATETHCNIETIPKIPNFRSFNRNRETRSKGGICIFVRDSVANDCVQIWKGQAELEAVAVMFPKLSPKVVVLGHYGTQSNSFGPAITNSHLREIIGKVAEWKNQGHMVIWCGDLNVAAGREVIPGNDIILSSGGKILNQGILDLGLSVANNIAADPTTHVDAKTGTSRALDMVISTDQSKINNFTIDHKFDFTPFTPKFTRKKDYIKVYSDHKALTFDLSVGQPIKDMKPINKPLRWQYNTTDGDLKYEILTNDLFDWMMNLLMKSDDIDSIVTQIDKNIKKIKFKSYNVKSCSSTAKMDEFDMDDVWTKRLEDMERIHSDLCAEREPDKIFKSKKIIEGRSMNDPRASIKDHNNGDVYEQIDDIFEYLLSYNQENMSKEPSSIEEVKMIQDLKDEIVDDTFKFRGEFPQTIPWNIYCDTVKKVCQQNKGIFRDFIRSGVKFKLAIFALLNKIYIHEIIPETFYSTSLTKLYKRKGDPENIKSYRFIHNKPWEPKLLEKCLVRIINDQINLHTPPDQIGGMAGQSCRDHLIVTTSLMRTNENLSRPTLMNLVDISACFDKVRLNDVTWDIMQTGADLKALKVIHMLSQKTVIHISGDPDPKRCKQVEMSVGQGTSIASKATSLSIGKATSNSIPIENCDQIGECQISPMDFVDDVNICNSGPDEARANGEFISKAMEVLSLTCNDVKSVIIVSGRDNQNVRATRDDLELNPVKLHGKPIKQADHEPYLGFIISKDGLTASVEKTIDARTKRGWMRASMIKSLINHPIMTSFGWLKGAAVLIQAILPPILSYSCEAWPGVSRKIMNRIESSFKDMVYMILELSDKTMYSAVLMEIGCMRMRHYIQKMQLVYLNQVAWTMEGSTPWHAVWEEWRLLGDKSALGHGNRIAEYYGIQPITSQYQHPDYIRKAVRMKNDAEIWRDCYSGKFTKERPYLKIKDRSYHTWPKQKARALLFWRVGSLRFKVQWKLYNLKRGLGVKCVMPMCDGVDSWEHMIVCPFYDTKWNPEWKEEDEIAEYLVKASRERFTKVRLPII